MKTLKVLGRVFGWIAIGAGVLTVGLYVDAYFERRLAVNTILNANKRLEQENFVVKAQNVKLREMYAELRKEAQTKGIVQPFSAQLDELTLGAMPR